MTRLFLLALCLVLPSLAHATTYYVDKGHASANNGGLCTASSAPCLTIQAAIGKAEAVLTGGLALHTILVNTGVYNERVTMLKSGSAATPFTLKGYTGTMPVIDGTGFTIANGVCLGCDYKTKTLTISYITFEGFEVRNWDGSGIKGSNADHLVIRRNYAHHNIQQPPTSAPGGNGFLCNECTQILVEYNRFYHNGYPANPFGHGSYFSGKFYTYRYNIMDDNAGYGLQCKGNAFNNATMPSTAHAGCANETIHNNVFAYNNAKAGLVLWFESGTSPTANTVVNNIFYENSSLGTGNPNGINFSGTSTSTTITNNVFSATGDTAVTAGTCSPGCNITGNSTTNPNMANAPATIPASPDYCLTSGSVAINFGTTNGSTITGNGLPDAGACESIPAPTAAVAAGNNVDITIPMSVNTPILPATLQSTYTVKFSGLARTTVTADKLTPADAVVRVQFGGAACATSDTITVDFSSGNVTDSAKIGNLYNQKLFSFTGLAVNASACSGVVVPPPTGPEITYHLNEASGSTVIDSTHARHGTIVGSPVRVTGALDGALDFTDQAGQYINSPWGATLNPTTQSATVCLYVAPDSTSLTRTFMGPPAGANQYTYLSIKDGTWAMGIQTLDAVQNTEFPVQSGYAFPCMMFDATTDTATLWVNGVKGTTTYASVGNAASIKPMTSFVWAGDWTFGMASGFDSSLSPGAVIDEIFIYEKTLTQQEMTDLYQSVSASSPPPTGTLTIAGCRFLQPRRTASGGTEWIAPLSTAITVRPDGYFAMDCQMDGTVADPSALGLRMQYEHNGGGTFVSVPDSYGNDQLKFYGNTSDPTIVNDVTDYRLTGALTIVNGATQLTAAAVPSVDLTLNSSVVLRYIFSVGPDAVPGDRNCFKPINQTGVALNGGMTPSGGLCFTVANTYGTVF